MAWEKEVEQIRERRARAEEQGGAEGVGRQHAKGRLTIRERIEALGDKGSFRELGGGAGGAEVDEAAKLPLRIFLSTGTDNDNQASTRHLRSIRDMKGYVVSYVETPLGHDWRNWKPA